ncbi:MAG: hypothetical protein KR126chlam6_01212 [Candidatus Anoxychlamydiales bacterium]|nr:hypothetical protein [Candidatus Anoxychlamydiales bacterium]
MSAGIPPAKMTGAYCVDFHISMLGNKYEIADHSTTYKVNVNAKGGKAYCYIGDTELCPGQLVLITKCCLKAFNYNNLITYVNEHGKCPGCEQPLSPDKITIGVHEHKIKDLTQKVQEQASEIVFLKAQNKFWHDLAQGTK